MIGVFVIAHIISPHNHWILEGKVCGTLGISREILEGHDRLGTLGIKNKFLGMAPLELRMEVLEGHDQLDTLDIIKETNIFSLKF